MGYNFHDLIDQWVITVCLAFPILASGLLIHAFVPDQFLLPSESLPLLVGFPIQLLLCPEKAVSH